jgi:hypothetical protein
VDDGEKCLMKSFVICTFHKYFEGKGKGVPNRPGMAQRFPGGLGSQIS